MEANWFYQADLQVWTTYLHVVRSIKNQIIAAAALEDPRIGFSNISATALLQHLKTEYGVPSASDLEEDRKFLSEPWNPDLEFELLWAKVRKIRKTACTNNNPISESSAMQLVLRSLTKSGAYGQANQLWKAKDRADKTWPGFVRHFTNHKKARKEAVETAREAGYHSANLLYTGAGLPVDIQPLLDAAHRANAAMNRLVQAHDASPPPLPSNNKNSPPLCPQCHNATDTKPKSKDQLLINYCWTHGLTRTSSGHHSGSCKNPASGHLRLATITNMQDGSKSIAMLNYKRAPSGARGARIPPATYRAVIHSSDHFIR